MALHSITPAISSREELDVLGLEWVAELYRKYAPALARVRNAQRRLHATRGNLQLERVASCFGIRVMLERMGLPVEFQPQLKPQLDDLEAEISYLLLRELRPDSVVEIAPDGGWSTTWLLSALRDNGHGTLHSYDRYDHCTRTVPRELAAGRWRFVRGDIRERLHELPARTDYLFMDCAHTAGFARWYVRELFPRLAPGTFVSVHDIYPERRGESQVMREWLQSRRVEWFTASPVGAPAVHCALHGLKHRLGLHEPIHDSQKNPMIFFRYPGSGR